jgi:hypothetical protein
MYICNELFNLIHNLHFIKISYITQLHTLDRIHWLKLSILNLHPTKTIVCSVIKIIIPATYVEIIHVRVGLKQNNSTPIQIL